MGDMRNVAERVSEGRSGSFFYYSHDGKFMVKTVSRAEVLTCCLFGKKLYGVHDSERRFFAVHTGRPTMFCVFHRRGNPVVAMSLYRGQEPMLKHVDASAHAQADKLTIANAMGTTLELGELRAPVVSASSGGSTLS